jgi:glycosyltransferase involved in cell wall biosynthesis
VSSRLRITYVADTLYEGLGGGVTAGRHLVERLRRDHDVVFVGADARAGDARDVRLPGFTFPVKAMREMRFVMARPVRRELARAIEGSDLVHLQFPFWLSFAARAAAARARVPVVAAFHVQPENLMHNVGVQSRAVRDLLYRLWVRRLYDRADAVVCPTRFAQRRLEEHGLSAPCFVVSNGVPPDVTPGPADRSAWPSDAFVVLVVGRLATEKRQDLVIEAVRRSRNARRTHLVLAGAGPREAELRALAGSLPNPTTFGFVPRERLVTLLRSADLLVHASEVELEGIAVLEAIRAGLPALVADAPESAARDLAAGDDFRFRAGDATDLAARLDALADEPARLVDAREEQLARAEEVDFEACYTRLLGVYDEVLRRRRAGAPAASNA